MSTVLDETTAAAYVVDVPLVDANELPEPKANRI
jgi:hypothetical protein